MEAPRDVPLRPGSRPVLFSGGRPLPASCYMLAGLAGFTSRHQSGHVRSVVAHSLPDRFEIVHESRVRMTVLFQCKLWLLPALFISQSPAHHRVYRDARSRDRERGLSKLSGVHVYTSRSDRLLFRLAALRPSEGPQRSALVAESGPSGPVGSLQHYCASVCHVCSLHKCMSFKQQFEWRLHVTSRPKLLVRSCPVVVAHSLPACFDSVRARVRSAWLWSPTLCRVV